MTTSRRRIDATLADRGTPPPSAIGSGVALVYCDRNDTRCKTPVTVVAFIVADPDEGRVWWARFADTGQIATHVIGDLAIDVALYEFRMAIARYRRWKPAPRHGRYTHHVPASDAVSRSARQPNILLLRAIDSFWNAFDTAPSYRDLLRLSSYRSGASIGYHLRALQEAGYIEREFGKGCSTRITPVGRGVLEQIDDDADPSDLTPRT